jgi:hypothetical protein
VAIDTGSWRPSAHRGGPDPPRPARCAVRVLGLLARERPRRRLRRLWRRRDRHGPNGYPSNEDATLVDHGFEGCPGRPSQPDQPPSAYTNGVVTPHAAFLALRDAPRRTLANLVRLEADFDIYGEWGFRDSVNVDTGAVSSFYLSLDQGMIMAAIGNALADDVLRRVRHQSHRARPVVGVEEFAAEPRGCTIAGGPGADRLRGTARDDVICAGAGDDRIAARGGDDAVFGDAGYDVVRGGAGEDTLYGAEGDDRLARPSPELT